MIHWYKEDNIGYITLENSHGNMLTYNDLQSFYTIIENEAAHVEGLVLTGSGSSFCTGGDISDIKYAEQYFKLLDELLLALFKFKNPLTVALNGHAIGAGFLILCCADFVVSIDKENAKFGLPEIKLGLGLDKFMIFLLSTVLSPSMMKKMIYSGEYVTYRFLFEADIVNKVEKINIVDACVHYLKSIEKKESFSFCKINMREINTLYMEKVIQQGCYMDLADLIKIV